MSALAFYSRAVMRCPKCVGQTRFEGDGFVCSDCEGGWVDLPATVPCDDECPDCGTEPPLWGLTDDKMSAWCDECGCEGSIRPAPWALAMLDDEVVDLDENGSPMDRERYLVLGWRTDERVAWLRNIRSGLTHTWNLEDIPTLARIVTPGSEHEQARAVFGLDYKETS